MTPEEKKIFDMQCPSTQKAMLLHAEGKRAHDNDWPPKGWLAVEDAKTWEELVGARPLSYEESVMYDGTNGLRRKRGIWLSELREEPAPFSVDIEKREKGIDAFMKANNTTIYSSIKSAFADIMRFTGLLEKEKVRR